MENSPAAPREQRIAPPLKYVSGSTWHEDEHYYVRRRNLDQYLLLYTFGGEGALTYGGREYPLTSGSVFLIDCREEQFYRTVRAPWSFTYIHFVTDVLKEYVDRLLITYGPLFRPKEGSALEELMRSAISLFSEGDPATPHRVFGLLAEILGILYASAEENATPSRIGPQSRMILRLMEERFADRLSLDDIAREIGYSKYYLSHHFKRDMGVSVYEYLTLMRISRSKVLLMNTSLSVAEVAAAVGFSSVSNFIRTFLQYESLTPHKYRKQWQ